MATDRLAEAMQSGEAEADGPLSDEAARARAYLDLWERHLSQTAIDGPIEPGSPPPA